MREHLATLAAIHELAQTLSPDIQKTIGVSVKESIGQLQVPEDVSIEF